MSATAHNDTRRVVLGRINGVFGVQGWVKVFSWTRPRDNLFAYGDWQVNTHSGWRKMEVAEWRPQGKGLVARLQGVDDRDQAAALVGCDVAVMRKQLPAPEEDSWYWFDVVGLNVVTGDGRDLGEVHSLMETGANDVLVVRGERERLIPFTMGHAVREVDLQSGRLVVDWDPDF